MKPRLPLNNLNTFATAAELSSFQAAAEALHVTPSAVSHQIRNLESLLGYELFERLDKRVKLTSRGERLFAELREPFRDIYKASESALHICQGNELSLSVAPAFATRWLLPRLESFYSAYPEIKLSLTATSDVVNFYRDDVDAAIRLGNGDWPGAESIKLFDMELVAVCLPSLLRAYQESDQAGHQNWLTPEQVAQQSLVINSSIPDTWGAWFASAGVELSQPLTGMQVQSASQSMEAIQTGQQICLIDRPFVERELASGQLVQVCDHSHHGNRSYYLAINQEAVDKVCLQQFRDWLLNLCR